MRHIDTQPIPARRGRHPRRGLGKPLAVFLSVGLVVVVIAMFVGRAAGERANRAAAEEVPINTAGAVGQQFSQLEAGSTPSLAATAPAASPTRPAAAATTGRPAAKKTTAVARPNPTRPAAPATTPAADAPAAVPAAQPATDLVTQVVTLTNGERKKVNCPALTVDARLTKVAQAHSEDMAAHSYFSHDTQSGVSPFQRITAAGYSFSLAAENIAAGQPTPLTVMAAWMASAGHRANILNCGLRQIGVGVATGGPYGIYWTQDFGTP